MKYDYLIIGAGPAGLQLAYFLEKNNCNYIVLEKAPNAGNFFKQMPRNRELISINKVYVGTDDPETRLRWDWNSLLCDDPDFRFAKYSEEYFPHADRLVDYLEDYAKKYQLKIEFQTEVAKIDKQDGLFTVHSANGQTFDSKVVIVATGIATPYIPNIPGIENCPNYANFSMDLDHYKNKRLLIIGKGNSGFEAADHLISAASTIHIASPSHVKLAWRTHFVGNLRAVNNNFLDTYQLKSQNALLDANIERIEKRGEKYDVSFSYSHANGEQEILSYDEILVATGFRFDASIFAPAAKPELAIDDRFPKQTPTWESTNVAGLYFAGAISQQRDYKKSTSAFIHGFRYNSAAMAKLLRFKYDDVPFSKTQLESSVESILDFLIKRINQNSALWQQPGFLGDLMLVQSEPARTDYYRTFPVDFIHQHPEWKDQHQFILTLEFGKIEEDEKEFALNRNPDINHAHESKFLHPIIRHFYRGEKLSELHIIEDLEAVWEHPTNHIQPLRTYLEKELKRAGIRALEIPKM